ncbi:hypothetical protein [Methyloprofundus sp.]|uniref:hypothetical protein n=1 Tax=Methyloprofundus sp. TaxID=2020875 RepID=UPI003D0B9A2A
MGLQDLGIIVSFRVINSEFSENNFIEIEITKEFYSNKIESSNIKIDKENGFGPMLSTFEKNIEWLTVISKFNDSYIIAGCAPTLIIENEMVIGETGIDILNKRDKQVSVQMFDLALNAFQQGISLADKVCKSSNRYCTERATYDIKTGTLSLPSVEYTSFGFKVYAKAKLEKVSEGIETFVITEIE